MQLDLKAPTLVVTGHWNPQIFDEQWIAKNLFEKPVGEVVEVALVLELPQGGVPGVPSAPIVFVDKVGVRCKKDRLELFLGEWTDDAVARAEQVLSRALTLLQHTPVHALGVNFIYTSKEVEAQIADKLRTREDFEAKLKVSSSNFQTSIDRGDGEVLNLIRRLSAEGVLIELNFHKPVKNSDAILALLVGRLKGKRAEAERFMLEYYDVAEVEVCVHTFGDEGERDVQ